MCYFRFFTFSLVIEAAWSYVFLIITVCEFYVGLISIYVIYFFFTPFSFQFKIPINLRPSTSKNYSYML